MTPLSPMGDSTLAEPAPVLDPDAEEAPIQDPVLPEPRESRPMSRDPLERTDRYRLSVSFRRSDRRSR